MHPLLLKKHLCLKLSLSVIARVGSYIMDFDHMCTQCDEFHSATFMNILSIGFLKVVILGDPYPHSKQLQSLIR